MCMYFGCVSFIKLYYIYSNKRYKFKPNKISHITRIKHFLLYFVIYTKFQKPVYARCIKKNECYFFGNNNIYFTLDIIPYN